MDGWMDGWIDGWMDGRMDVGRTHGWIDAILLVLPATSLTSLSGV